VGGVSREMGGGRSEDGDGRWERWRGIRHQFLWIVSSGGSGSHHLGPLIRAPKWPINQYLSYHLDSLPKINFLRLALSLSQIDKHEDK
jgi:hypothetical protein